MQPEEVRTRLAEHIDDCEFYIEGEGCNFQVTAVGERFEGMSRVRAQQLIYSALADEIASGALHAVSIKTFTPEQWADNKSAADGAQG